MGKNFCRVEWKWCKFLKHDGTCAYCNSEAAGLSGCPRIKEMETKCFHDAVLSVEFDNVFAALCKFYPDQEKNRSGYKDVFSKLRLMAPAHHRLDDLYINIEKYVEDGVDCVDVSGVNPRKTNGKRYAMDLSSWTVWNSMFITQETLDTFTAEEIVAACLYEMTFFGFEENSAQKMRNEMFKAFEEIKENDK